MDGPSKHEWADWQCLNVALEQHFLRRTAGLEVAFLSGGRGGATEVRAAHLGIRHCLVGAGAIVTEGKVFPDNSLILGAPAKVVRELTVDAIASMQRNATEYVAKGQSFKEKLIRIRQIEGQPVAHLTSFIPQDLSGRICRRRLREFPILVLLEEAGVKVAKARQTISARLADASVAYALGVPVGAPLLASSADRSLSLPVPGLLPKLAEVLVLGRLARPVLRNAPLPMLTVCAPLLKGWGSRIC